MEAKEITDKKIWDGFILKNNGYIVQSWEWGEFKKSQGTPPTRIGLIKNNELVAVAQYTLHKIPFVNKFIAFLPKGPVVSDPTYLKEVLEELKKKAKEQKCVAIKLEPQELIQNQNYQKSLKSLGLIKRPKTLFPEHNLLIDLTKSEEDLLKEMHPKWRYNIRLANKKGIKVNEDSSEKGIETFNTLLKETAKRDKFYVHQESYYKKLIEILNPEGLAYILTANLDKTTTAAWILFRFDKTLYYVYGATNYPYRSFMNSHALMWETIRFGKKLNCTTLDLWGVSPPNKEDDPWYGFTKFKEGFGGKRVQYIGAYDLIVDPDWYYLFNVADKTRWMILNLFKKI